MRIALVHPDLGIGGAERLVVDIATGLQQAGHSVEMFTSFFDESRAFDETTDGTIAVTVLGDLLPRHILGGKLTIIFAILRQLHLVCVFLLCLVWGRITGDSTQKNPVKACRRGLIQRGPIAPPFDVIIVDQLSACIPFFQLFTSAAVVFYCHFPDQLLTTKTSLLKRLYRLPVDAFEEATTRCSDVILVNSKFTRSVFRSTFRTINDVPQVVYPGIQGPSSLPDSETARDTTERGDTWITQNSPDAITILSLNRFENKKKLELAVETYARFRKTYVPTNGFKAPSRLILAGGYDPRLPDNVQTLKKLQDVAGALGLSSHVYWAGSDTLNTPPTGPRDVLFVLNISHGLKQRLLDISTVLLYTPENEHFGIVPIEAMAAGTPVLAADSGGPRETIDHKVTGYLLPPDDVDEWVTTLCEVANRSPQDVKAMSLASRQRVDALFSLESLAKGIESACLDAITISKRRNKIKLYALGVVAAFITAWLATLSQQRSQEKYMLH